MQPKHLTNGLIGVAALNLAAALALAAMFLEPREEVGAQAIDSAATSIQVVGAASPGLSVTDRANIYYDTTADQLQLSVNGGAYASLAAGSPTGSGANTQIAFWTGASTLSSDAAFTYTAASDTLAGVGILVGTTNLLLKRNGGDTFFQGLSGSTRMDVAAADTLLLISDSGSDGTFEVYLDSTSQPKLALLVNGHLRLNGTGGSIDAGSTCTSTSNSGGANDSNGTLTGTCTAGQTILWNFQSAYGQAPACVCSAVNAAGGGTVVHCSASTTVMTFTSVGAATAGTWAYFCVQD